MSTTQDSSQQYRPYGDSSRFHARQSSASSLLAATTFGGQFNPLATPSSGSAYGSISWPSSHSVSPSIWSQSHQGRAQWPAPASERHTPCYANYGGYYFPRSYSYQSAPVSHPPRANPHGMVQVPHYPHYPQHLSQIQMPHMSASGVPQVSQVSQVPQVSQVTQVQVPLCQTDPVLLVPSMHQYPSQIQQMPMQVLPQQAMAQQVSAPLMAPYLHPAQMPQYPVRAPLQPYQNMSPPETSVPLTEYDVGAFSKFYVAAATGILGETLLSPELAAIEQYVSSLLCATRLPRSTVLVSFVFLNKWHKLNLTLPSGMDSSLRSLVTCSLVLANKINDDNTFTNASWGLVSGFPPRQITKMELFWLDCLHWSLELDETGVAEWHYWDKCWSQYEHNLSSSSLQSPLSFQGLWPQSGCVFEPFSVAVC